MSAVLDLCDKWDMLSKGETPTTKAVREAHAEDAARLALTDDELRTMAAEIDTLLKMPLSGDTVAPSWVSIALDAIRARRRAVLYPDPSEAGA